MRNLMMVDAAFLLPDYLHPAREAAVGLRREAAQAHFPDSGAGSRAASGFR